MTIYERNTVLSQRVHDIRLSGLSKSSFIHCSNGCGVFGPFITNFDFYLNLD